MLPHIKELRLQKQRLRGNTAHQLLAFFFQFIQWFGENRDAPMEKDEGGLEERPLEERSIMDGPGIFYQ